MDVAIALSKHLSCSICFDRFDPFSPEKEQAIFACLEHVGQACVTCLKQWMASGEHPGDVFRCPIRCHTELSELDVVKYGNDATKRTYDRALLERAIRELPGRAVTCPRVGCGEVVRYEGAGRDKVRCICGEEFCSQCKQPYHYRVECATVQATLANYQEWIQIGRAKQLRTRAEAKTQNRAYKAARRAFQQLADDERHKASFCRLCPNCNCVVEKTGGCNAMRCGYNPDAGASAQHAGCGASFNWAKAKPYKAALVPPPETQPLAKDIARMLAMQSLPHGHWRCDFCDEPIVGLRFQCIHCPSFSCCTRCEADIVHHHPVSHVFEILEPSLSDGRLAAQDFDELRLARDGVAYTRDEFREYYLLLAQHLDNDYYRNWLRFWNEAYQATEGEPLPAPSDAAAVAAAVDSNRETEPSTKRRRLAEPRPSFAVDLF